MTTLTTLCVQCDDTRSVLDDDGREAHDTQGSRVWCPWCTAPDRADNNNTNT